MAERVLIIKLGALGDIIMSTALIKGITSHHFEQPCTLLTTSEFEEVFSNWETLQLKTFPRHGLYNNALTLAWIRNQGFTHIYDLQGSNRSRVLCYLSKAPTRIGNHPSKAYTHHPKSPWLSQNHIFDRMIDVCNSAGVDIIHKLPYFPPSARTTKKAAAWINKKKLTKTTIALLHAGCSAARPEKKWPYFPELALFLQKKNITPVWIGGETDHALNLTLSSVVGINATMEFSVSELVELGRHAKFAVTNDSGPMHILSAAGIPIFGIFGPSDWQRNYALGQEKNVIALKKSTSAHGKDISLYNLKVPTVIRTIERALF